MKKQGVGGFKYFVGISSLAQIATRQDRVCVLNILGGESSNVTPVGHEYSGGNVVFGTSPGRRGQVMHTASGISPSTTACAKVSRPGTTSTAASSTCLRPAARDGVAELIRVNQTSRRSSSSPRRCPCATRARSAPWASRTASMSLARTVSAWPTPGTKCASAARSAATIPREALKKGSIAILSNSGNFTHHDGHLSSRWPAGARRTLISSGKDVYIHYAAPDSLSRSPMTHAARRRCSTSEPGGYYELDAEFTKPVVACVVGRWKTS